jgi:Rod binding domain-containing protein
MTTPPISPLASGVVDAASASAQGAGKEAELAKEFEAVFISQFVDEMMKTVDYGPAAGGQGAEMWRSFLSQALADKLSERGGLGLSGNITQMLGAYRR